jgi:interleukin-1 receptor-associated kinase 1
MFEIFAHLWDIFYEFVSSLWFSKTLLFEKSGLSININDTRSIGEGAYSLVYKGTKQYDRSVQYAVKKMLVQSQEFDLMVQNEVESLSRFNHKNIIKLVDATRKHEGNMTVVYILLPYAKNGSLRDLLNDVAGAKKTRQPIIEVLSKFNEICNAFNVLHTFSPHSYVHQDIKPEAILICSPAAFFS